MLKFSAVFILDKSTLLASISLSVSWVVLTVYLYLFQSYALFTNLYNTDSEMYLFDQLLFLIGFKVNKIEEGEEGTHLVVHTPSASNIHADKSQ